MTHRDYSWNSAQMSMMSPQGSSNNRKPTKSRVEWTVEWVTPVQMGATAISLMQDAERRLCEITRQAVHHAVVSGSSTVTIKVVRAPPMKESR